MSTMFFYYSPELTGGWIGALADARAQIIKTKSPKLVTVLDVSAQLDSEDTTITKEQWWDLKYRGPFYADWDCEDLMEGAESVQRFLIDLKDKYGVDPRMVRIFATGGRGYHVEVPFALMSANKRGEVKYLPLIYKEMAQRLYTEYMDLAIYSTKRGRMWRTPNVQRDNGRYKVPISYQQLKDITPESYEELTSEPQEFPQLLEVEEISPELATLFSQKKSEIDQRMLERKKRKVDNNAIAGMGGTWPEAALELMSGKNLTQDAGLNKIALQLGILSVALGKDLKQHLEACAGLIETYKGNGHSSPSEVRKEVIRMFKYADDNPAYEYSPGAFISCMQSKRDVTDLTGENVIEESEDSEDYADMSAGVLIGSNGMYTKKDGRSNRETNWHFDPTTVSEMQDPLTLSSRGFVMVSRESGRPRQSVIVDHAIFTSAERMKTFLAEQGAIAPRMDSIKAGGIGAIVMNAARGNTALLSVEKEGLNLIERAGEPPEVVWASSLGCIGKSLRHTYKLNSASGARDGTFCSDVTLAPNFKEEPGARELIDALLNFNGDPYTVGMVLGWMVACWHKPFIVKWGQQFPILQCYGESGSGKTATCLTMLKMFYYRMMPKSMNAAIGSAFGRRSMYSATTSIPLLVDEFKPERMDQSLVREFRMMLHEIYTPFFSAPRGGGSGPTGKWNEISFDSKTTPVLFTTEIAETETAVQERTIAVRFSKKNLVGHQEHFKYMQKNGEALSSLGNLLLRATVNAPLEKLEDRFNEAQRSVSNLNKNGNDRIVYNIGVALYGINFLETVVKHTFQDEHDARWANAFDALRAAITASANTIESIPELVKILRNMITVSHYGEDPNTIMRLNKEFTYMGVMGQEESDLDMNVDAFYVMMSNYYGKRGHALKFQDVESFYRALQASSLLKEDMPGDSAFTEHDSRSRVVRLDGRKLSKYSLGIFKIV